MPHVQHAQLTKFVTELTPSSVNLVTTQHHQVAAIVALSVMQAIIAQTEK
jgi:hypothetical protein